MLLSYADENVAEHIAVPKRTSAVFSLKYPFAVFVGDELFADLIAEFSMNGLVKFLGFAVNIYIPVLAAAILAKIGYAFESFVKIGVNFERKITS